MFESLQSKAQEIIRAEYGIQNVNISWERPQQASFGDIATPVAMQLAKELKKNPKEIASTLAEKLQKDSSVEKAEVAGPGYVNVWLKPQALIDELKHTREACTAKVIKRGAPVVIDYSAPNIAKPLGIHHILSTVIGQVLGNLYRHSGTAVVGVNHVGDWGTQFGKLAVAYELWGMGKPMEKCTVEDLLALYVKFHEEAEKDASLEERGQVAFKRLEEGDQELRAFWEKVVAITLKELGVLYARLHVTFDHTHGESFYEEKMEPVIAEGKKKKVFLPGEKGALVVQYPEESGLPPAIVLKADGATIYMTRDLATVRYRLDTWKPQAVLYVVDVAQALYFRQLFAAVEQLGWNPPKLEHVQFGRMRFADKNMSTRKGNILRLEEVLDEAVKRAGELIESRGESIQSDDTVALAEMMGVGAVVYGILSQNRQSDLVFDWDRMLSFEGNSAPYLQYTHARARSVLRKADASDVALPAAVATLTEGERSLVGTLLRFPEVLEEALSGHLPHVLTHYLYQLCQAFNAFYNSEPILQAEKSQKSLRLALTSLTAAVLKCGAELLTLRVPDRM
ncbi:arginine--tRNA ligase [Candidatus Peribacteria bacterium RIFCSPHIGHO2_01_FULL_55_13]|nr:MAG: arginine--tRNA ligase [Candidatus Peribacteria bacterium RIFCSPHIGHO2_01_FULL_55_13]